MPEETTEQQPQQPKDAEEKTAPSEETETEEESFDEPGGMANFLSPEAMIMFPLAVLLDLIGLILLLFVLDDFFITDIIGIVVIGGWTFFRSGQVQMTRGAQAKFGKATKQMKPLLMFAEFIPYVGALPCWTILVYSELKS